MLREPELPYKEDLRVVTDPEEVVERDDRDFMSPVDAARFIFVFFERNASLITFSSSLSFSRSFSSSLCRKRSSASGSSSPSKKSGPAVAGRRMTGGE